MPFLLLLYLTLACLQEDWHSWPRAFEPAMAAALTWLGVALEAGLAALISRAVRRTLARHPERRDRLLRRYGSWRFYHSIALFVIYGISLYVIGWGWAVQSLGQPPNPPPNAEPRALFVGAELLILAPFLAGLVLSWLFFYDAERAFHDTLRHDDDAPPFWGRRAYVSFHVRHNLALVFVPVILLVVEKGLSRLVPDAGKDWQFGASAVGLFAALCVFICMPWILRLVLGLRPMPDGPVRRRLLAVARRLNFRCTNILLWNTRGGVANAMVAGVVPQLRYVLMTDRLINELAPEEVEAVFGHEVGHVKHHHMLYYLGFLVGSMTVLWVMLSFFLREAFPDKGGPEWRVFPLIGILGAYIFVVF